MRDPAAGQGFAGLSVLMVCTGNICRSPFAELLLRHSVPEVMVASSGIHALEGEPLDEQMARHLAPAGIDAAAFRARQVSAEDLEADLVLTMSARQRAFLLREYPYAARRTGLLGHLPELAHPVRDRGGVLRREDIARWTREAQPAGREIPDPYRRGPEAARRTADLISDHVRTLASLLTGEGSPPLPGP